MSTNLQKNSILRNRWDDWMRIYKESIRGVADRAGLTHTNLARSINLGVASETTRKALRDVGIPEHLIPLPNDASYLAKIIYEQQPRQ